MRYILDTHSFLCWMTDVDRLPVNVVRVLREQYDQVAFSTVCAWEIVIKTAIGKLEGVPIETLESEIRDQRWRELPLLTRHLPALRELPFHHHDPFDRALVAQAMTERLTSVSGNPLIRRYDADVLWQE